MSIRNRSRAPDARNGHLVSIHLERKILQRVAVVDGVGRVASSQLEHLLVRLGVVLDPTVAEGGDVIEPMDQVGRKVGVGVPLGHVVAEHTHRVEALARLVRARADDGLVRGVLASPMATVRFHRSGQPLRLDHLEP